MIISKEYALKLVRIGKAKLEGKCFDNGNTYMIVTRYDLQRVDHFLIGEGDLRQSLRIPEWLA